MFALTLLTALFLILLIALGFASVRLLGARDEKGELVAPGCLNGCAMALVLSVLAFLGAVAFIAGATAIATAESVRVATRDLPEMKIGVWSEPQDFVQHYEGFPLHVVLQWKGHSEPMETLLERLREEGLGDSARITREYTRDENDEAITVVDIALPAQEHDLDGLRELMREFLPKYNLSEGVEITLRSVQDESGSATDEYEPSEPEPADESESHEEQSEDRELR